MLPFYALVLVLFIEYIRPDVYFPILGVTKIGTILPLGLLAATVFAKSKISHAGIWESGNARWLAFFLFLITVSLLTADVTLYAYRRFTQDLGYFFLFYIIAFYTDTDKKLRIVLLSLVIIHILLIFLNPDIILHPEVRNYMIAGPFLGDGNDFALSLCITFPMCLYLVLSADTKMKRIIFMVMLAILLLSIIGTQSRGATLGLACILAYLWWEGKNKFVGIVALFILLLAVLMFAPPEYFSRMETLSNYEQEGSAKGRLDAWRHATEMALANPILGVGAGHFPSLHGLTAHSMYFLVFAELGFPGITYLIAFLLVNIFRNKGNIKKIGTHESEKQKRYRQLFLCLNGSMIGFAVSGAFLSVLYYPHSFVLGAIMLVANFVYRNQENMDAVENKTSDSRKQKIKSFVVTKSS